MLQVRARVATSPDRPPSTPAPVKVDLDEGGGAPAPSIPVLICVCSLFVQCSTAHRAPVPAVTCPLYSQISYLIDALAPHLQIASTSSLLTRSNRLDLNDSNAVSVPTASYASKRALSTYRILRLL